VEIIEEVPPRATETSPWFVLLIVLTVILFSSPVIITKFDSSPVLSIYCWNISVKFFMTLSVFSLL